MKHYRLLVAVMLLAGAFIAAQSVEAHSKKGYKLRTSKADSSDDEEMVKGSFMVASQCKDCNHGYQLDQIVFSGFDKPRNSKYETFFITNNTDRILTGVNLYIEYQTLDGRMLHKRLYPLRCRIPAGETRQVELNSWDTQRSFVYEKSSDNSKRPGTPFRILFDPVAFYLSF